MERLFTKKTPICSRVDITVVALGLVATLLAVWVVASHRGFVARIQ